MAIYTIRTNRTQQVGLQFSYDNYADKDLYPTVESFLQSRVDHQITNPMYEDYQKAQSMAFDASFDTVPELEQPAAQAEIEQVIISHGGTIVPASPPVPAPIQRLPGGMLPSTRGTSSNPIQIGGGIKEDADSGRRDGEGDNEAES